MNTLERLADFVKHKTKQASSMIGHWIVTLEMSVPDTGRWQPNQVHEYLVPILRHTPYLRTLALPEAFLRTSYIAPLQLTNLAHLDFTIQLGHIEILPLINQFRGLQILSINFIDNLAIYSRTFTEDIAPLHIPSVHAFAFSQAVAIHGIEYAFIYMARSSFRYDCELSFDIEVSTSTLSLLNPLFQNHASSRITLDLYMDDSETILPANSLILSRARNVTINHIPPPELFRATRLPSVVTLCANNETQGRLRMVLDALVANRHARDMRLVITMKYPSRFTWQSTAGWSELDGIITNSAELGGSLLPYAMLLVRKGIDIIDQDGKDFGNTSKTS
jgi:hypothetical protein